MILDLVEYEKCCCIEKVIFLFPKQMGIYRIADYENLIYSELPICGNQVWIGNISRFSIKNVEVENCGHVLIYKFVRLPLFEEITGPLPHIPTPPKVRNTALTIPINADLQKDPSLAEGLYIVPQGVSQISVTVVGAGGNGADGGGGGNSLNYTDNLRAFAFGGGGGGGGGGGLAAIPVTKDFTVSPGQTFSYKIGYNLSLNSGSPETYFGTLKGVGGISANSAKNGGDAQEGVPGFGGAGSTNVNNGQGKGGVGGLSYSGRHGQVVTDATNGSGINPGKGGTCTGGGGGGSGGVGTALASSLLILGGFHPYTPPNAFSGGEGGHCTYAIGLPGEPTTEPPVAGHGSGGNGGGGGGGGNGQGNNPGGGGGRAQLGGQGFIIIKSI